MGRPTDFTEDLAVEICSKLADGLSLRSICAEEDMPGTTTVYRWLENDATFRDQYARARELQAETLFDEILDISDDGVNDWMERRNDKGEGTGHYLVNGEALQRSKLRVETRKWVAGKLKPKKYGEKQMMEHTGKDGGPIKTEEVSGADKLKAVLDNLAKRSGTNSDTAE